MSFLKKVDFTLNYIRVSSKFLKLCKSWRRNFIIPPHCTFYGLIKQLSLTIYAGLMEDHANAVAKEFQKESGVKTTVIRLSGGEALKRIDAEKQNPKASVWYGGPADTFVAAKEQGLLEKYESPTAKEIPDKFKDKDGYWTGIYNGYLGFVCNSKLLKEKNARVIIFTFMLLLILFAVLAIIASFVLSKNISKPINELSDLMDRVEKGDRNVNFSIDTEDEIAHMGNSFNNMLKEINRLIEEVYIKQYLLKEAEFKALKAQVNPHFLYNTLESINWMAKFDDLQGVSTMVTSLGKFLRYSISKKGDIVTVEEELQQVNNYLTIQKIRYRDKFQVFVEVEDEVYKQNILRLLIQPLVENAITHGLEQKRGNGKLFIKGYLKENIVYIDVIDDGIGVGNSNSSGEKIGLSNVDNRIKLHYGDEYGVELFSQEGVTISRINIPGEL